MTLGSVDSASILVLFSRLSLVNLLAGSAAFSSRSVGYPVRGITLVTAYSHSSTCYCLLLPAYQQSLTRSRDTRPNPDILEDSPHVHLQ